MEPLFYVFGNMESDCNNPVLDYLGKFDTEQEAQAIKECFAEAYDYVEIIADFQPLVGA